MGGSLTATVPQTSATDAGYVQGTGSSARSFALILSSDSRPGATVNARILGDECPDLGDKTVEVSQTGPTAHANKRRRVLERRSLRNAKLARPVVWQSSTPTRRGPTTVESSRRKGRSRERSVDLHREGAPNLSAGSPSWDRRVLLWSEPRYGPIGGQPFVREAVADAGPSLVSPGSVSPWVCGEESHAARQ